MRAAAVLAAVLLLGNPTAARATTASPTPAPEVLTGDPLAPELVTDTAIAQAIRDIFLTVEGTMDGSTDVSSSKQRELTLSADVLFAFGSASLAPTATGRLAEVAEGAKEGDITSVTVEGHTDSVGEETVNLTLSQQRAEAVRAALAQQLPGVRFVVVGKGEAEPVVPNTNKDGSDDPVARAKNRRVVVTVAR